MVKQLKGYFLKFSEQKDLISFSDDNEDVESSN